MHTAVTTRSSDFFKAAMSREWKEGQEKEVTLPDTDEQAFEGYLQWLYTGELTLSEENPFRTLTEHYILGDFLADSAFCGSSLDGIVNKTCENKLLPSASTIELAWEHTLQRSPMRKLYLEAFAAPSSIQLLLKYTPDPVKRYPAAFIYDCFQHFITSRGLEGFNAASERDRLLMECRRKITSQQADGAGR